MATKRKTTPKESFSRYDSADYLRSREDMVAYMEAALEEGGDDPAYVAHCLGVLARAHGMLKLAEETGLTREGLYRTLSATGNPSLGTVMKVMKVLGLSLAAKAA